MTSLKSVGNVIKNILIVVIIALLIFTTSGCGLLSIRTFPEKKYPKVITLSCNYRGNKITLQQTLYKSVYDYYSTEPDKKNYMTDDKYQSFVFSYKEDKTIKELAAIIEFKGNSLGLSSDETMDLAVCVIQNINYDAKKGKLVLSGNGSPDETRGRFPYETLYDNKGICTDKSYLLGAIIKELGYGTALLAFDKEQHMALGVATPNGYTSFSTEYSFIEATNTGYAVGQLPAIDSDIGGARTAKIKDVPVDSERISDFNLLKQIPKSDFSSPSKIYKIAEGKKYQRIIETTQTLDRTKQLISQINSEAKEILLEKKELESEKENVEKAEGEIYSYEKALKKAESVYDNNTTQSNYNSYTQAYNEYKAKHRSIKAKVDYFNANIESYNSNVKDLNDLIGEYNQLIKSAT